MDRNIGMISPEILWVIILLCVSLSIMGCSTRWIHPDDLSGLDEWPQKIVAISSRVPVALILGSKVTRRLTRGYRIEILRGRLTQLPDGKSCWYNNKYVEFEIQHRQFHAPKYVIGSHSLLLRLSKTENINSGFTISVNGKRRGVFKDGTAGEGWYEIASFIRNVDKAIDAYFSVKTRVSIQSEEGVCLTAIILAHTGDSISFLNETKFVDSIRPQTALAQSRFQTTQRP